MSTHDETGAEDTHLYEDIPMQECPPGPPHGPDLATNRLADGVVFFVADGDPLATAQSTAWLQSSVAVDTYDWR